VTWFVYCYVHFVNNTQYHIYSVFKLQEQTISNQVAHCTLNEEAKSANGCKEDKTIFDFFATICAFLHCAIGI